MLPHLVSSDARPDVSRELLGKRPQSRAGLLILYRFHGVGLPRMCLFVRALWSPFCVDVQAESLSASRTNPVSVTHVVLLGGCWSAEL